ncbi:DUF2797 domain-containing protein [Kordia zhangzhouensis]|uniref:DUF2797 domain-containing protein n=1 Tax=Kordia zhangzhouensis TaxID=1620405 RepID=UPI00062917AF|nr:DUF2797 domain-containing protein [Kordia zhangzhouensis]
MMYQGVLTKMQTEFAKPIQYYLNFEDDFLNMNQLLDRKLTLNFEKYECLNCHLDKEIYRQGFCKSCFFEIPTAGDWIMRPELSTAHLDIEDRDLEYEKKVQLQPHIVYLALSSEVKVGVTRKRQVPTRWIDQGAIQAVEIAEVPNRYLAGVIEVALKSHVSDKTNWRKMLQNLNEDADLLEKKAALKQYIPEEARDYYLSNREIVELDFPVLMYPQKIKSLNLVKAQNYTGVLKGIKGQYLMFEDNTVFNIRGNEGLVVRLEIS